MLRTNFRKGILLFAGILSVGLAIVGIVLPLLPTTPFLLLAAACFARSSDRLYRWLITHKQFGPYIENYRTHRAIPRRAKIVTLLLLWITMSYTTIAIVHILAVRVLLVLIGTIVTIHILRLRTFSPDMVSEERKLEDK